MRHLATDKGANAIFLFIAELNGFKKGTVADKRNYGIQCYINTTLHDLDENDEDDRADFHENIWLERLYRELDTYYQLGEPFIANIKRKRVVNGETSVEELMSRPSSNHYWETPIELDASASMLQYMGLLLGDKRLLEMTNVIGTDLSDPWEFEGIPRDMFKKAATPMLYGSSRQCHELWQDRGFKYTLEQVQLFNAELANGALGLANQFKEFLINNVKPKEYMKVKIFNEEFEIECNKYKHIGEEAVLYDIFDTQDHAIRRIKHTTTKKVPDLDQFRRYFATLLIHNLDSQVANIVIGKIMDKYQWGIDIHDAFIINPEAAEDTRLWYGQELTNIYNNRHQILADYFTSIGIGKEAQSQWEAVKSMIIPVEEFKVQGMALK